MLNIVFSLGYEINTFHLCAVQNKTFINSKLKIMFTYKLFDSNGNYLDKASSITQRDILIGSYKACGLQPTVKRSVNVPQSVNAIRVNGAITLLLVLFFSISGFSQSFDPESGIGTSDVFVMEGKEFPVFENVPDSGEFYIKIYDKDNGVVALWLCEWDYMTIDAIEYLELTGIMPNTPEATFIVGNAQSFKCADQYEYAPDGYHN